MRLIAVATLVAVLATPALAEDDPRAVELLERMDTLYQQDSARAEMTMEVVTPDFERTLRLESWSLGLDYSLVRVLEPARERGVATLKREDEMWNYLPRVSRVVKVPPSMMMGAWMGSDFTNDDLMRETSWTEEYSVTLTETADTYELELIPREQTVTVWGGMTLSIDRDTLLPLSQRYFDEDGTEMRVMTFEDVTTFDGVTLPARLTLTPLNKEGHRTTVEYRDLDFDVDLDASFFTLQNLRRGR